MTASQNVFKTKQGKIIITLFFIVLTFLIGLNIWDHVAPNGVYRAEKLSRSTGVSAVYVVQTAEADDAQNTVPTTGAR